MKTSFHSHLPRDIGQAAKRLRTSPSSYLTLTCLCHVCVLFPITLNLQCPKQNENIEMLLKNGKKSFFLSCIAFLFLSTYGVFDWLFNITFPQEWEYLQSKYKSSKAPRAPPCNSAWRCRCPTLTFLHLYSGPTSGDRGWVVKSPFKEVGRDRRWDHT